VTGDHESVTVTVVAGIGTGLPGQQEGVSVQRGIAAVPENQTMNLVRTAGSYRSPGTEVFVRSNRGCLEVVTVFEGLTHQVITRTLWSGKVPIFTVPWMTASRIASRSVGGATVGAVCAIDVFASIAASPRLIPSGTTHVHRERATNVRPFIEMLA
jgi:hypothetical protein